MTVEPEQEALFELQGPDDDGCVWACSPAGARDVWCQNLGPVDKVAEVISQWLATIHYDEQENHEAAGRTVEAIEEDKRQAKIDRKAARPADNREEGGQG